MKKVYAHELSKIGGKWLSSAREWIQQTRVNGDRVHWSSDDVVHMTVKDIEDLAAHVAAAVMNESVEK